MKIRPNAIILPWRPGAIDVERDFGWIQVRPPAAPHRLRLRHPHIYGNALGSPRTAHRTRRVSGAHPRVPNRRWPSNAFLPGHDTTSGAASHLATARLIMCRAGIPAHGRKSPRPSMFAPSSPSRHRSAIDMANSGPFASLAQLNTLSRQARQLVSGSLSAPRFPTLLRGGRALRVSLAGAGFARGTAALRLGTA